MYGARPSTVMHTLVIETVFALFDPMEEEVKFDLHVI
jgi:hypothetical protein